MADPTEFNSDIISSVKDARKAGLFGDYDTALRLYLAARQEAQAEINTCRNRSDLSRWNSLVKGIVEEESAIRRIKNVIDESNHLLNSEESDESISSPTLKPSKRVKRLLFPKVTQKAKNKSPKPRKESIGSQPSNLGLIAKDPNVQWDSIAGLEQVKRLLRQNLVILPLISMRRGVTDDLITPWKSVLLYGPPGNGKTFLAKAVATECKRAFFNVTSALTSSYQDADAFIANLFEVAERMAPSTIFFDEVEAIASRCTATMSAKFESEEKGVLILAATNFPWDIDESLLMKFQKRVYVPLPDNEGRLAIISSRLSGLSDPKLSAEKWAKSLEGYSCSDIVNLCKDVAKLAFDKQTSSMETKDWISMSPEDAKITVTDDDFERALCDRKSTVGPAGLARYEEWRAQNGAE